MSRGASGQPDLFVFTFDSLGTATSVAEVQRNGSLAYERIDRDESYRLSDGLVVKTEIDDGEQAWTIFADPDGDGRWAEVAEGEGAFQPALLALMRGEPVDGDALVAANPGGDRYVFDFDGTGRIVGVSEVERNGRLDREPIERGETYELWNGLVIKTELDDGEIERTLFADPDGDGVWVEIAELQGGALFSSTLFSSTVF